MFSPPLQRLTGTLALASLLLICGGCGLTDYEARLEMQQKRLKYMEEANKNLNEGPVNLSDRATEEVAGNYKDFFLRLPLGISADPTGKPVGRFDVYPSLKQDSGFRDVLLAVANEENGDRFKNDLLKILNITGNPTSRDIPRPLEKPLGYDFYQGQNVQLYIPQNSKYQTAIAFRTSGSGNAAVIEERIKFCLASFADGTKAQAQRTILQAQTRTKKKPADKKGEKGS